MNESTEFSISWGKFLFEMLQSRKNTCEPKLVWRLFRSAAAEWVRLAFEPLSAARSNMAAHPLAPARDDLGG